MAASAEPSSAVGSSSIDDLPELTPEYFFKLFGSLMRSLDIKQTDEIFKKDWREHILPQQKYARQQAKDGMLVHTNSQGRPATVFPMLHIVQIPKDLLGKKEMFISSETRLPPHMQPFSKRRTSRSKDPNGHPYKYYFHPILVIFGPQLRKKVTDKYFDYAVEDEVLQKLTDQYDGKLSDLAAKEKRKRQKEAVEPDPPSSPGISFPPLDSEEEEEIDRKLKQQRRQEKLLQRRREQQQQEEAAAAAAAAAAAPETKARFDYVGTRLVRDDRPLFQYLCGMPADDVVLSIVTE